MAKALKNDEKRFLLRIPIKIARAVLARAKQNQRSLNGQIIFEIDQKV